MERKLLAAAFTTALLAFPAAGYGADPGQSRQDGAMEPGAAGAGAAGATQQEPAKGAPRGGFQWPKTEGNVEVLRGEVQRFADGKIEAGGVLGLGTTDINVTKDTLIVSEDGKSLSRKDLQKGAQVATIYKQAEQADRATALVIVVEQPRQRGAGGAGTQQQQKDQQRSQ